MARRFNPTHEITLRDKRDGDLRTFHVALQEESPGKGGPAYTREEWNAGSPTSWEVVDGQWWCKGEVSPAPYLAVVVRKIWKGG